MADIPKIHITQAAQAHFQYLIKKEDIQGMGLRIFVDTPKAPHKVADVSISFCPPGNARADDIPLLFEAFTLHVAKESAPDLENAEIDYKGDKLSGQLAITAPHLRGEKPKHDDTLADKVNKMLAEEINPSLASHGGMVTLMEVTPTNEIILRFGGGCHGCGMVDVTLKHGIEKSLKEKFPEITAVRDVTDHSVGENPYYA